MITLTNILLVGQLIVYIVGFTAYLVWVKADIKINRNQSEANFTIVKNDINVMKSRADSQSETLKQLTAILTTVAVQDNRLNNVEADIREIRRGESFVLPLPVTARNPSGGATTG